MPRRATFTAKQVDELRRHYAELPPAHFAQKWGVSVGQVYELARRNGIKRRAPNGAAVWRRNCAPWGAGSRWATP